MVLRALARDRSARFASIEALDEALATVSERLQGSEPAADLFGPDEPPTDGDATRPMRV